MKQKGNKKGFTGCAQAYIRKLQEEGRFSTAHVYKNAVLSFTKFCTTPNIAFGQITRDNLRRYGQYLYEHGLKPNTVSTYMRMLRSIYNRSRYCPLHSPAVPGCVHRCRCTPKESTTCRRIAYASL